MAHAEYRQLFIDESVEHLQNIQDCLFELEKDTANRSVVEEIFRSAHTLKGMAATMEFTDVANLTHTMENVLDLIRSDELTLTVDTIDVMFQSADALEEMVQGIASGGDGTKDVTALVERLEKVTNGEQLEEEKPGLAVKTAYNEFEWTVIEQSLEDGFRAYEIEVYIDEQAMLKSVRAFMVLQSLESFGDVIKSVPTTEELEAEAFENRFVLTFISREKKDVLEQTVGQVSEIQEVNISDVQTNVSKEKEHGTTQEEVPRPADALPSKTETSKTVRINVQRLDTLMNLFEELIINRSRMEGIAARIDDSELTSSIERLTRNAQQLQDVILSMRMMSVEHVFNRFPSMVRKLSKELGKSVDLQMSGTSTELDRSIIDEIGDPLVHLLRNSIDHGIEHPETRREQGKREQGTIQLRAFHRGNSVYIEVSDDGAGINREKVKASALGKGVITHAEAERMDDHQIYQLLFSSGFSTATEITNVSGRGVGLDVVKQTFESLGGKISVSSTHGSGSVFSIQLPLTLSIMDVMLVQTEDEWYGIPISSIVETAIVKRAEIYKAQGKMVTNYRNHVIPVVHLSEAFEIPPSTKARHSTFEDDFQSLIIVKHRDYAVAIAVESLVGQQDVVLKSLGNYLGNVKGISGAAILGNGDVILIIDTNSLLNE
ncbi:chemotaxis protein CheW [Geomicrobium sp. JSM 1781026]|uniref:chemotaxis protein CheW n=1 Tax=Geomicrobium sp. JSM 1781026 TaxID=3344580 RepID=UPI0035C23903